VGSGLIALTDPCCPPFDTPDFNLLLQIGGGLLALLSAHILLAGHQFKLQPR